MSAATPDHIRTSLLDLRVLRVGGDDRYEFLQGQLTQDIERARPGHAALTGWTSPKGRLLAVGPLLATDDALWWPLPADIIEPVARRLGMFVLRSKVDVSIADLAVAGLMDIARDQAPSGFASLEPGRTARNESGMLATRLGADPDRAIVIGPGPALADWQSAMQTGDASAWQLADVRAGLPSVIAATSEQFIPQMLNLDLLDAVSFTKGCYVGQEIVARTQNLGRIKRRMFGYCCAVNAALAPGATIYGPGRATGKVVMTADANDVTELAAVVAIDQANEAWFADEDHSVPLAPRSLPYEVSAPA